MFSQQINPTTGEIVLQNYGLAPVNTIIISPAIASMSAVFPSKSDITVESRGDILTLPEYR